MIYPTLQDAKQRQNQLLREAKRQYLINLAMSSNQHPQTWQSIYHKIKERLSWVNLQWVLLIANRRYKIGGSVRKISGRSHLS